MEFLKERREEEWTEEIYEEIMAKNEWKNKNYKPTNPRSSRNKENYTKGHHSQIGQNYYKILKAAEGEGVATCYMKTRIPSDFLETMQKGRQQHL